MKENLNHLVGTILWMQEPASNRIFLSVCSAVSLEALGFIDACSTHPLLYITQFCVILVKGALPCVF